MGKATRWLKSLFGLNREKEPKRAADYGDRSDEKRWSFGHSRRSPVAICQNPVTIPPNLTPAEATWLRSFYSASETEKEQNKHAIAVAAATAAAADAAVAAAQAAAAVVRLTSHGRGTMFGGGHERMAAIKIQSVFRGYLARKAHRALKGLVRLQALVRGFLVRKQADATFHCMQALLRAQATVRSQKARSLCNIDARFHSETRARRSMERFDDTRSECMGSFHSRRLSASLDSAMSFVDESPKIVEVDTGRPKSRSRRNNASETEFGYDSSSQFLSSPHPNQFPAIPAPISLPDGRNFQDPDWGLTGEEYRFSTAQSTPRFASSSGSIAPITVEKNVFAERQSSDCPNYMANTKSSKAKLRSHSAPRQRPDTGLKRRLSLSEMMECRSSLSGVRMQRSCSQAQDAFSFKNAVMGKMERSVDFGRISWSQKGTSGSKNSGEYR